MSFNLPVFNLPCNVWHSPSNHFPQSAAPDLTPLGNLAVGRIAHLAVFIPTITNLRALSLVTSILFPKLTDIRDASLGVRPDAIECPAGSGRYYWVTCCDDVGKGFGNEHRIAVVQKVFTYGDFSVYSWPTPMP